jgi:hypothetical protein
MDGLPGMRRGVETARKDNVKPIKKMVGPYAAMASDLRLSSGRSVSVWYLGVVAILSFCMGIIATFVMQLQFGLRSDKL